jgi:hypothetical protein
VDAATGMRIIEAMVKRQAAITIEGASSCAKRIKIDAVETANIPNTMATVGDTRGFLGEFIGEKLIIDEFSKT